MFKKETKLNKIIRISVFVVLGLFLFGAYAYFTQAQIPSLVNYQGKLKDSSGNPITSATTIQFSLYSHITNGGVTDTPSTTGPLLWTETYDQGTGNCQQITPGTGGIFAQHLGDCVSFPDYLDFTKQYYLGVKVGTDSEASPRVPLTTNPYAFTAKRLYAEGENLHITTNTTGDIIMSTAGAMEINSTNGSFSGAVYASDYAANYTNRSLTDKAYVDAQLMWEIDGDKIQPKNNSVRQISVEENSNSYTQFIVTNTNDTGIGAGAVIELKGSGADFTNNMYIGKYGASFWIPELADNGAVLTDKNLVIGTASNTHQIDFVTGDSYSNLQTMANADNEGFRYTSDLSPTYTNRTLVDKEYVDGAISSGTTASNGLTKTGTDIQLGGILTGSTNLTMDTNGATPFTITDSTGVANGQIKFIVNAGSPSSPVGVRSDDFATGIQFKNNNSISGSIGVTTGPGFTIETNESMNIYADSGLAMEAAGVEVIANNGNNISFTTTAGGISFSTSTGGIQMATPSINNSSATAGQILTLTDAATGNIEFMDNSGLTDNLYTADGTLTAPRSVNKNGESLSFTGRGKFSVESGGLGIVDTYYMGASDIPADNLGSGFGVFNSAMQNSAIRIQTSEMRVADAINNKGLIYANNYSANYTNRSLVDKEYVDNITVKSIFDTDSNTGVQVEETANEDAIRFDTAGAQRMIINNDGRLSFNTEQTNNTVLGFGSVPSTMTILQRPTEISGVSVSYFGDDTNPARFATSKARGSEGSETSVQNGDDIAEFVSVAHDGTQYVTTGGIIIEADGAVATNNVPSKMLFLTNAGATGHSDRMVLDSNGWLGIGDLSPVAQFVVGQDSNAGYANGIGDAYIQNDLEVDGTIFGSVDFGFAQGAVAFTGSNGTLNQDSTNFYWDQTNHRLGLGTSSPEYHLSMVGTGSGTEGSIELATYADSGIPAGLYFHRARGTEAAPTAITSGLPIGGMAGGGYDGTTMVAYSAAVQMESSENWSSAGQGTEIFWSTIENGTTGLTKRMTLTNDGRLGVGMPNLTNGSLGVDEGIIIGNDSTDNLIDNATNGASSATLYIGNETIDTSASDRRVKDVIGKTSLGLKDVLDLDVVDFTWKDDYSSDNITINTGLIAQDVYKQLPYLAKRPQNEEDGLWTVKYNYLSALAVRGIQEQQNIIEIEKDKLAAVIIQVNQNTTTIEELQDIFDDSSLKVTNAVIKSNTESIDDNKTELETLSRNITELTVLTNGLAGELNSQEARITAIEVILAEGGLNIGEEVDNFTGSTQLQVFSDNLVLTQEKTEGIKPVFTLKGDLIMENLQVAKITIDNKDEDNESVGTAIIEKGETSIIIETGAVDKNAHILLTPHKVISVGLSDIDEDKKTFTITINEKLEDDLKVEWFIIQEL